MEKERIYRENISRVIQNKKRDAVGIVDNRSNQFNIHNNIDTFQLKTLSGLDKFTPDELNDVKERAFAECHDGRTYSSARARDTQAYDDFYTQYITGIFYGKNVDREFNDKDDLKHQVAQDYLLYKTETGQYAGLVGIHHQYDSFTYVPGTTSGPITTTNLRIYRSMPLHAFLDAQLYGHGGSLGMALKYDQSPSVLVEFDFGNTVINFAEIKGNQGSSTTDTMLGRKTENKSCLPQTGAHASLDPTNKLHESSVRNIFSVNFGNVSASSSTNTQTHSFMNANNPQMRVVFDNGINDTTVTKVERAQYEYMKENVHSYTSWILYKQFSINVRKRIEQEEQKR